MHIIVGLGNPGLKYDSTRHNVGFEVIERFAYEHNININQKRFKGLFGQGVVNGEKVLLLKPQTYMNLSGESVKMLLDFYQLLPKDLIIVYDDISLDIGQIRIRKKGSAGGHNGVKNIIQHLGTNEFPRIKVGVGEKPPNWNLADYVLSRFSNEEMKEIKEAIERSVEAINEIIDKDIVSAMNKFNSKK